VIEQFGLRDVAGRKVMDLSGGFKRRVQVAKVFMVDTPVVFLDEFSTGMDPILKRSIMERLRAEAARGRTIVLTTQILSEAEELCDDILILNAGREAARGDVNTLKLLSSGTYDVTITFERMPAHIDEQIAALAPVHSRITHNTVVVTVKADEAQVLDIVQRLAQTGSVLRLEVNTASLEDIFIGLTGGPTDPSRVAAGDAR